MIPKSITGIKRLTLFISACPFLLLFCSFLPNDDHWETSDHDGFEIRYTQTDSKYLEEYADFIQTGIQTVSEFFQSDFRTVFRVYIHPDRSSLDEAWQRDWKMPEFRSQCWMVASGVAAKLDILSLRQWQEEACEHDYSDKKAVRNLITHELVHVFHGQFNASPDFSDVREIDWWVEGMATYVSGQCDSSRIAEVVLAVKEEKIPDKLNDFWSGRLRYGLSGTLVMYIDHKYGRNRLIELLPYNDLQDILQLLATTEPEIIIGWKEYILQQ
jgi:hypothetical protein